MRRRTFLLAAAAASLGAAGPRARASSPPVVGFLGIASRETHVGDIDALVDGLAARGLVRGRNLVLEERYADGLIERSGALIEAFVAGGARVLVVPGPAAALAVRKSAPRLPVVAVGLPSTPVYPGLFESLARPGGSVTGFSHFGEDLAAKRVEIMREAVPGLRTIAILHNAVDPLFNAWGEQTEVAARRQGLATVRLGLSRPDTNDLAALVETARRSGATAMIIVRDFMTHVLRADIVRAATDAGIAAMGEQRDHALAGALLSYGASFPDLFRRAAAYVDEILKGASPATLPIQLATTFELVINQRTAAALGLALPQTIMVRADEVIE